MKRSAPEDIDNEIPVKRERKLNPDDEIEDKEHDFSEDESQNRKPLGISSLGAEIEPIFRKKCPYLDTVNRQKLDFDQQKVCSTTLTNMNVYACLVCGKYFQGKSKFTPAYTHSVQMGHFVFINLQDTRAFCLPDDYEIIDAALNDVKRCLAPSFTTEDIKQLNINSSLARDVYGVSYLPGFVGMNNLQCTDYINVVLHALSHVTPLRNYFLQDPLQKQQQQHSNETTSNSSGTVIANNGSNGSNHLQHTILSDKYPMLKSFTDIVRKLWSRHNFKSVISPAEFCHVLSLHSQRRFTVNKRVEVSELFNWLINELHKNILAVQKEHKKQQKGKAAGSSKEQRGVSSSIIHDTFQGDIEVRTVSLLPTRSADDATHEESSSSNTVINIFETKTEAAVEVEKANIVRTSFNMLSLDIPPSPLFRDSQGAAVIPQIPLFELLKKFDGQTWTDSIVTNSNSNSSGMSGPVRKQYVIRRLPQYLVFHLTRFSQSGFSFTEEKNATIVTFPVKNLEMKDYLQQDHIHYDGNSNNGSKSVNPPTLERIQGMTVSELRAAVTHWTSVTGGAQSAALRTEAGAAMEKSHLVDIVSRCVQLADSMPSSSSNGNHNHNVTAITATKYDLIANICHDTLAAQGITAGLTTNSATRASASSTTSGTSQQSLATGSSRSGGMSAAGGSALSNGTYRIHLANKGTSQWFEIQDLHVSETMPQLVGLSESNLLIYERQQLPLSNQ